MLTIYVVLALAALIIAIVAAVKPSWAILWVSVVLLCVIELMRVLPGR